MAKSIRLSSIAHVERIDRRGALILKIPMSFIGRDEDSTTRYVTFHAPVAADVAYKLLTAARRSGSSAQNSFSPGPRPRQIVVAELARLAAILNVNRRGILALTQF